MSAATTPIHTKEMSVVSPIYLGSIRKEHILEIRDIRLILQYI